jgi:hypothetical protein
MRQSSKRIVLSTRVLAITNTFAKDVLGQAGHPVAPPSLLMATWLMCLISIGAGILTMLSLVAILDPKPDVKSSTTNTDPAESSFRPNLENKSTTSKLKSQRVGRMQSAAFIPVSYLMRARVIGSQASL